MYRIKLTTKHLFIIAIFLCISMTLQTQAAPGDLDLSFGNGGRVLSANFEGNAIAIQSDGKIVATGGSRTSPGNVSIFTLERYNTDGSLDTSFGTGGRVVTLIGSVSVATAVAIQSDGKIVAAGNGSEDGISFGVALARYNTDGSLDTSFGTGGKVLTKFNIGDAEINDVALQSDGKIVVAGFIRSAAIWDFLVVRYNPNGSLDASFGSGGMVVTSFGNGEDEANDIAIQSDGKIVAAGSTRNATFYSDFALARYNTNGSLDTSFDSDGKVVTPFGNSLGAEAIVIQTDGKIIAVGTGGDFPNTGFALARYNTNGSLDTSFGTGGKVLTLFLDGSSGATAVAIQSDGKIIAGGGYFSDDTNRGIALARYNTNGSLDTSFGTGGRVVTPFQVGANDLAIQSDGKIVVLASSRFPDYVFALFRYQGLTESSLTVTRSDDRDATCVPGDCSLREAVKAANASTINDTINFASGLMNVTLTGEIVISNAGTLTVEGPGANVLTIDGGAGANRIFSMTAATVNISGVTLTGGNATGGFPGNSGGAIYANQGSLTLDRVHVTGNSALLGGGLFYGGGTHRIINSTISANTGGGITAFNSGVLTIVNSTISGNTGGGIYNEGWAITFRNVTITSNTADTGGGIYNFGGSLNFGNTIVAGNIATNGGNEIGFNSPSGITSAGGNLFGDSPGDSANIPIVYQPTDIRDTNPLLGVLQNNGGPTPTHALFARSPAIDKGLNALISPIASAFDQRGRGFARIRDGNDDGTEIVDIGAFEVQLGATATKPTLFDFDGDGKADISIYRPETGEWWYIRSSDDSYRVFQFGTATDKIVPADYTGDGKTDIAIFRPSTGEWFILRSEDNSYYAFQFGIAEDIPVPADYDGDGKADAAVYRPSTSVWYILKSTGGVRIEQYGTAGDVPVPADYNGDRIADIAVYNQSAGTWKIRYLNGEAGFIISGNPGKAVPADYTGDGKADIAFYNPASNRWFVIRSENFSNFTVLFGASGDIPAPADYDGDGKTDFAIYRPSTSEWWYIASSANGEARIRQFGTSTDIPVPSAYIH